MFFVIQLRVQKREKEWTQKYTGLRLSLSDFRNQMNAKVGYSTINLAYFMENNANNLGYQ